MNEPADIPERETFVDCAGKERIFSLQSAQVHTGWIVDANEVTETGYGYRFEGFSATNPYMALGEVRVKIRAELATKYLSPSDPKPTLSHDRLRGHIDRHQENQRPLLVVDGIPLSMEDLEHILGTYEGWRVDLRIVGPAD